MKKKNKSEKMRKKMRRENMPRKGSDTNDVPIQKAPDADRYVDDFIRKYNDFPIIDRD